MTTKCDVLIIGGGPAGSTVGSLLRKYAPHLSVSIVERERFPRQHIGESQLSATCRVLHEMEAWDKVEAAGFPVKIGSTYRWGRTPEPWNINFLPDEFRDEPRPGKYEGQRALTAFQVDRSVYDKILLDHASDFGCEVREGVKALQVHRDGDRITSLTISSTDPGTRDVEEVEARYFVDASGGSGMLRRAMGVDIESPTCLHNVAFWDYWQNAEWAVTIGNGGTRAQIMSIGWGWIWFIPISSTRTSIGVVTPATYLKASGKRPEVLYTEALAAEKRVTKLIENATRESIFQATKDWSYIAKRLIGENWFLVGDACGFADPILSAGMTLAHVGARKAAYTILELERGEVEPEWLRNEYNTSHRANILQHVRFAEYWYSSNGQFTDLTGFCAQIAKDSGIDLAPDAAWQWMGTGGFAGDTVSDIAAIWGGFHTIRNLVGNFAGAPMDWQLFKNNEFCLDLDGCMPDKTAVYSQGRIIPLNCLKRGEKVLPMSAPNEFVCSVVARESDANEIVRTFKSYFASDPQKFPNPEVPLQMSIEAMETMIAEGWIKARVDPDRPFLQMAR